MHHAYIDPWSPDIGADLLTQTSSKQPDAQLYVLVDTAFTPGLHARLLPHGQWEALFDGNPSDETALDSVSPWLGHVTDMPVLMELLHAQCSGAPCLSIIVSTEPLKALAARLKGWCLAKADGQWFNLRFPDTRRLPGIWSCLSPAQQQAMLGPATAWHYITRDGRWSTLPGVKPTSTAPLNEVCLTDAQFADILTDCQPDELLFKVLMTRPDDKVSHSLKFQAACRALSAYADQPAESSDLLERFDIELTRMLMATPEPHI